MLVLAVVVDGSAESERMTFCNAASVSGQPLSNANNATKYKVKVKVKTRHNRRQGQGVGVQG